MKENPPYDQARSQGWDIAEVSGVLAAEVEPHFDVLAGKGFRLRLTKALAEFDLFPGNRALTLRRPFLALHLANVQELQALEDKVRIEASDETARATVVFQSTGEIVFNVSDQEPKPEDNAKELPEQPATIVTKEETTPQKESKQEQTPIETAQETDQRAIRCTGRIGKLVETKTPTGKLKLIVPLAVRSGEDTTWHRITFWEDKAEQILKSRKTGDLVTVVFYEHPPREVVTKTGVKRLVPDLRGAAIYAKEKK